MKKNFKRTLAALLAALLLTAMLSTGALASGTDYQAEWLAVISETCDNAPEAVTGNNRVAAAVCFLLDYMSVINGDLDDIDAYGTYYIGAFGDQTIDFYFPCVSGGYRNLFYGMATRTLTDYGKSTSESFKTDKERVYYAISGTEIYALLLELTEENS